MKEALVATFSRVLALVLHTTNHLLPRNCHNIKKLIQKEKESCMLM